LVGDECADHTGAPEEEDIGRGEVDILRGDGVWCWCEFEDREGRDGMLLWCFIVEGSNAALRLEDLKFWLLLLVIIPSKMFRTSFRPYYLVAHVMSS
jgi:hypothetical protein